jgi:hypothetical protein
MLYAELMPASTSVFGDSVADIVRNLAVVNAVQTVEIRRMDVIHVVPGTTVGIHQGLALQT